MKIRLIICMLLFVAYQTYFFIQYARYDGTQMETQILGLMTKIRLLDVMFITLLVLIAIPSFKKTQKN
jgi:hypothetical protein